MNFLALSEDAIKSDDDMSSEGAEEGSNGTSSDDSEKDSMM